MYKIIGTDQKEYGPVASEQIHQWITQGRIHAQTRVQADGGEWKTLGDYPEFATAFANRVPAPTSSPNPLPASAPPAKTSGLAIASLVLGILGIFSCGLSAIAGLIMGIMAMSRVKKSNGALGGQGIALAGTIVSAVFLIFVIPLGAALLLPALANAKDKALTIQCMNNLRQLSVSARLYAGDHQDHFPPGETWCDALKTYAGSDRVFKCAAANPADRCDYAFNSKLAGLNVSNINGNTVLFFETDDGWNQNGGPELMLSNSRHRRAFVIGFADGHVEQVISDRLSKLRWEP